MSTRLDLVLAKYPIHEDGIRLLAARDPSGNQKYLDWAGRMLAAEQALAPEISDVLDLFHRFRGQRVGGQPGRRHARRPTEYVHPDVYTYRPQDFAGLRDALLTMKRAQDRKQKKRERLYRIEGAVEAAVVYDSPDLIVRHIMNKQASVHYGLGTRWCIAMLREGYFDDYTAQNATFFFFERKVPLGNEFDKACLMVPRGDWAPGEDDFVAFTATDQRVASWRSPRRTGRSCSRSCSGSASAATSIRARRLRRSTRAPPRRSSSRKCSRTWVATNSRWSTQSTRRSRQSSATTRPRGPFWRR
jgi:hypothetical protein